MAYSPPNNLKTFALKNISKSPSLALMLIIRMELQNATLWAYMPRVLKDPSKSQGPIQAPNGDPDGRDRQTGHVRRPDPCLRKSTREYAGYQ